MEHRGSSHRIKIQRFESKTILPSEIIHIHFSFLRISDLRSFDDFSIVHPEVFKRTVLLRVSPHDARRDKKFIFHDWPDSQKKRFSLINTQSDCRAATKALINPSDLLLSAIAVNPSTAASLCKCRRGAWKATFVIYCSSNLSRIGGSVTRRADIKKPFEYFRESKSRE